MGEMPDFRPPLEELLSHADMHPRETALKTEEARLSYGELKGRIMSRAGFFRSNNVRRGHTVSLYTTDDIEMLVSLYGLWALGATAMPLNVSQPQEKIQQIEGVVVPDVGFYSDESRPTHATPYTVSPLGNSPGGLRDIHSSEPDDRSIVMFTSGTSGVPKAVPIKCRALGHNAWEAATQLGIRREDRLFINAPPFYTSSIIHALTMFSRGGGLVVGKGFHFGSDLMARINEHGCTGFGGVPIHFKRLVSAEQGAEFHEGLRFLMNSGEHLPTPVLKEAMRRFPGVSIHCVYGLTEVAGRLCFLDPKEVAGKLGSVGRPIAGMEVSIRGEGGDEMPSGREGEVFAKGICLMEGYLKKKGIDRSVIGEHGFGTGDVGFRDGDGDLFLRGRKDDVIKVGAEKVSLKLIEDAVHEHAAFEDFYVSTVFDEHMGNVPCLHYVLKAGERFSRRLLVSQLKKHLPASHIPSHFREVQEVPRSSSGKLLSKKVPQ